MGVEAVPATAERDRRSPACWIGACVRATAHCVQRTRTCEEQRPCRRPGVGSRSAPPHGHAMLELVPRPRGGATRRARPQRVSSAPRSPRRALRDRAVRPPTRVGAAAAIGAGASEPRPASSPAATSTLVLSSRPSSRDRLRPRCAQNGTGFSARTRSTRSVICHLGRSRSRPSARRRRTIAAASRRLARPAAPTRRARAAEHRRSGRWVQFLHCDQQITARSRSLSRASPANNG